MILIGLANELPLWDGCLVTASKPTSNGAKSALCTTVGLQMTGDNDSVQLWLVQGQGFLILQRLGVTRDQLSNGVVISVRG